MDGKAPETDVHSLLLPETDSVPLPVEYSLSALKWFHMQHYFNPVANSTAMIVPFKECSYLPIITSFVSRSLSACRHNLRLLALL